MWEKAISYSSKQRCYMEVIRVWAILADHDKQSGMLKRIEKLDRIDEKEREMLKRIEDSHRKGKTSNAVKKMKFRYSGQLVSDSPAEVRDENGALLAVPRQFDVVSDDASADVDAEVDCADDESAVLSWYPPAVPSADSYVLLKFYECTKGLLRLYCAELEERENTDFPFRLSPTEQEICDLQVTPPCSTLLLGRSGTGCYLNIDARKQYLPNITPSPNRKDHLPGLPNMGALQVMACDVLIGLWPNCRRTRWRGSSFESSVSHR